MDRKTYWAAVRQRPLCLLIPLFEGGALKWLPDKTYLKLQYRVLTGKKLRLDPPVTFNEKIQWLKLYDRNPLYRKLADKLASRRFVAEIIGEEYLVPLLGTWDDADGIDFASLPDRFALKCTHGYGGMVLCRDKSALDQNAARQKLAATAATDFFSRGREWAYKNENPRILAEQLIDDGGGLRPADYKFMCFHGQVQLICISRSLGDREAGCVSFFWPDGTPAPFKRVDYPECSGETAVPAHYAKMKEEAEKLAHASAAPFIRVDFYEAGGKVYFSEFTFYPCGGTMFFDPPEYDQVLGEKLTLSSK